MANSSVIEQYTWTPTIFKATTPEAGVDVWVWDAGETVVVSALATNASGTIAEQTLTKAIHGVVSTVTSTTNKTPHKTRFLKYGIEVLEITETIAAGTTPDRFVEDNANITEASATAVSNYTGFAIDHGTDTVTLSGATVWTEDKLYDRLQYEAVEVPQYGTPEVMSTVDGINHILAYDLIIDDHEFDGNNGSFAVASGKEVIFRDSAGRAKDLQITGDARIAGSAVTSTLDNVDVTGTLEFEIAQVFQFTDSTIAVAHNSAGATVTIDLLGDSAVASTTGDPIVLNQAVTLTVNVIDSVGSVIASAQTSIFKDDPVKSNRTEYMNKDTNASGISTEAFNYPGSPVPVIWKVRKSDNADDPRYFPRSGSGTITTAGFEVTVTLRENEFI